MSEQKDQHKVGTPEKPRGQEMGTGFVAKSSAAKENTPATRGERKDENAMFGDESEHHVASNPSAPNTNSSSVPNALPAGVKLGESGGEREFKERHADKK
jgi:hypothetical protein